MPTHTFRLSVWDSTLSLPLLGRSTALSLSPPHPLLQGGIKCLFTLFLKLSELKTNAPYSPKSENPRGGVVEDCCWMLLIRDRTLGGIPNCFREV